jgi:putative FmdB family regulatory protein
MPIYEYEHCDTPGCPLGAVFEIRQGLEEPALTCCPECRRPVRKLISRSNISTPRGNAGLKDLGFTKLVRRDAGVYENVTARQGESRYVLRDQPATLPNLSKTIRD